MIVNEFRVAKVWWILLNFVRHLIKLLIWRYVQNYMYLFDVLNRDLYFHKFIDVPQEFELQILKYVTNVLDEGSGSLRP